MAEILWFDDPVATDVVDETAITVDGDTGHVRILTLDPENSEALS